MSSPVEAIDEGSAEQGEQQPGQLLDEDRRCDCGRLGREGRDQQRPSRQHRPVAEVGDGGGGPDLAKVQP
jgi:hypothetical protein